MIHFLIAVPHAMEHAVFHLNTPKLLFLESGAAGGLAQGDDFVCAMLRNVCSVWCWEMFASLLWEGLNSVNLVGGILSELVLFTVILWGE